MTQDVQMPKLWNRNFTILIVGSFISMAGYNIANFAMGLLVFDETSSVWRYSLVLVASMLSRIITPMIAGTYFDRHSRRKAIFTLDYLYTAVFGMVAFSLYMGVFNYWLYIVTGILTGAIDGLYMVAFDSLFPILTTKQTATKAYSMNSLLFPLAAAVGVPFSLLGYDSIGAATLFLISAILFFFTATFETRIIVREPHLIPYYPEKQAHLPPSPKELELVCEGANIEEMFAPKPKSNFFNDFKEGIQYLRSERGLAAVTIYFCICSLSGAVYNTLLLPFFRTNTEYGMLGYILIGGGMMIGRIVGANVHYRMKLKKDSRFKIALSVYFVSNIIFMVVLHLPIWIMAILMFVDGCLAVTSYNIRISSTQCYVPDEKRGRFNGAFLFFNMLGSVGGQLIAGALGDIFQAPWIMTIAYSVNLIAIFIIVIPFRKKISEVYNQDI